MQEDSTVESPRTSRRADVSVLTGLGVITYLVSRLISNDTAAAVVGFVALLPLGAAAVIAVRSRLGGAMIPPVLLFVGAAALWVLRLV